jgi:Xaa-Pro aminopeptidase
LQTRLFDLQWQNEPVNSSDKQPIKARDSARSRTPHSEKFLDFISSGWAPADNAAEIETSPAASYAANRRFAVGAAFIGNLILIEAGASTVRSNDTEYRYRPHSAFAHLTGWGSATVPDSVLAIDSRGSAPKSILFFRETAGRTSEEFFANAAIGEFWVGPRPGLADVKKLLDIETRSLSDLERFIDGEPTIDLNEPDLAEFLAEMRFVKDDYEIGQMREAVAATVAGFDDIVDALPKAMATARGERVVEAAFFGAARLAGNDLGYETIAAAGDHACTLHWIQNDGDVRDGDLILVDAGVEVDSLYTADLTRTLPVNGKFSEAQRTVYEAVLEAADAVFAIAKPGIKFRDLHAEAMKVIAAKTAQWGLLPVTAEESLKADNQYHRRWMVHGTSHWLGLDVHDCAAARRELYLDIELKPGMIFTIEPGLYFHRDDLLAPAEFRGIGVRIEDDVLVTENGVENLSAALPRTIGDIESWISNRWMVS